MKVEVKTMFGKEEFKDKTIEEIQAIVDAKNKQTIAENEAK